MNKKCQIFTPSNIVNEMLRIAEYDNKLYGKKFLENSCGDGNILVEIVSRYITSCKNNGIENKTIKIGLEKDILAYEIDENKRKICIDRLNKVTKQFGIKRVRWSIFNTDFLNTEISQKFDFIIGNPPYISYHDLDETTRSFIKKNFKSCIHGKPDYCYPFIEKSINLLSCKGVLVYLIPKSIFKNVYAEKLRSIMLDDINKIYDFSNVKLFKGVTTSSVIFKIVKNSSVDNFLYSNIYLGDSRIIEKSCLGNIWNFSEINVQKPLRVSEYFAVQNSVATLRNKVFVLQNYEYDDEYIYIENYKIEKKLVYEASSPKGMSKNIKEVIIFPYKRNINGELEKFTEKELSTKYPNAYQYLLSKKDELVKRTSDSSAQWFEYGRSQAISKMTRRKLLISKIITNFPETYILSNLSIPYSGIFIYEKSNMKLEQLKEIIESEDFFKYVVNVGTNMSGNSIQISTKIIEDYTFNQVSI